MMKSFTIRLTQIIHRSALIGMLLLLSACTTMNNRFDCPVKPGVMCKRLDQVNTMVDTGELGAHSITAAHRDSVQSATSLNQSYRFKTLKTGDPLRAQEHVVRIWIAPFEDASGNYHDASYHYTVIQHGHWNTLPPTQKLEITP